MKQLIVCSASDRHHLQNIVRKIKIDTTVLASAGGIDEAVLNKLATEKVKINLTYQCESPSSRSELLQEIKDLERAYFVVASAVMSSSAFQAMSYSLFPRLLQVNCWKMTLEDAKIPLGFAFLRHLPEGVPFKQGFRERMKQQLLQPILKKLERPR